MNQGKYVFSQLTDFLPQRIFDKYVERYTGNSRVRHLTCWNQMMCMMFGQLSGRESLSDLITGLTAHRGKSYHLGLGPKVTKSNLAKANKNRDWRIYASFAYELIEQARKVCIPDEDFAVAFDGPIFAFDSTTIDLCLSVFWWAPFRKAKAGIKLHTLYDVKTSIPTMILISDALTHDVNALDWLDYEKGGFYIFDRGYVDFKRLHRIHEEKAFFIVRAKTNLKFNRMYSLPYDKKSNICSDQIGILPNFYSSIDYPDKIRRVKFFDEENRKYIVVLTNNFILKAEDIALLYRYRWKVELFFRWIKQHLKIKSFWGTSLNAVKIQIYIAIITYTLVSIIKSKLRLEKSTYEILQILSFSLIDKTLINELLTNQDYQNVKELCTNQLSIF
jgi:hypothetical protein